MKAGEFGYMETYLSSELHDTQFSLYGAEFCIKVKCVFLLIRNSCRIWRTACSVIDLI